MRPSVKLDDPEHYTFERYFAQRAHPRSIFNAEILPGVFAQFGEPKSRLHGEQYHLMRIKVDRKQYNEEMADTFWSCFHVTYIGRNRRNKKLPHIHRVLGSPSRPIQGGYVVICEPHLSGRNTFLNQHSYNYWLDKLYTSDSKTSSLPTPTTAISSLINKIGALPKYNSTLDR